MRKRTLLFLVALVPMIAADLSRAPDAVILAHYAQLRTVALDPGRVALTENFVLQKDAARFEFKSGNLYFFQPVAERVAGAVFIGEGVLRLKPPTAIERNHLAHFIDGASELEEPFNQAVLLFSDSTSEGLSRGLKFRPEAVPSDAESALDHFRKTFRDDVRDNMEASLVAGLCFPPHGIFIADIKGKKHGKLLFRLDPREEEPVQLIHYNNAMEIYDLWCSFAPAGNAPHGNTVHAARVNVDAVLKGKNLAAESRIEFSSQIDGPRLLHLELLAALRVSKVTWGAAPGRELKFIQEPKKKDADLWVILPEPLAKDTPSTLDVVYEGDEVIHSAGSGNFYVGARQVWYPRLGDLSDRALYHLKFQSPKDYTLIATGNLVSRRQEDKMLVTEWNSEVPYSVTGFNYGKFKPQSQKEGAIDVTVYANESIGDELAQIKAALDMNRGADAQLGITTGGFNTTGMAKSMLAEAVNSLRLFNQYFGPIPFKTLAITQQPSSFYGQSWPTLVFMPYTSFLDATTQHQLKLDDERGSRAFLKEVGSHEIAHQWWGHLVDCRSYHDEWLSEGFAEYSAGLYTQTLEGEKKFKTFLENQRIETLERTSSGIPARNDAGPIWLGRRLSSEKHRGASRLIYSKGAYVLHMLRMMQYDFVHQDDSRFMRMMQDFLSTYSQKNASTEDFKSIVDKHFGRDMGWFFKQWVYGTEVPDITVEYSVTENAKGALLKGTIRQSGVSPDFLIRMPCLLKFAKGASAGGFPAKGAATPFEVQLPLVPNSVEFNPLDAVLCRLAVKKIG